MLRHARYGPRYGSDGLRGKIETASIHDKPYTDETLHAFSYKPSRKVTVADVIQIINDKKRDQFNFSPEWEGCRFWLSFIMQDFEDGNVVDQGSAKTALEALLQYWINPEGSEPRVMREGLFRGGRELCKCKRRLADGWVLWKWRMDTLLLRYVCTYQNMQLDI